jgi:hypothetical protein
MAYATMQDVLLALDLTDSELRDRPKLLAAPTYRSQDMWQSWDGPAPHFQAALGPHPVVDDLLFFLGEPAEPTRIVGDGLHKRTDPRQVRCFKYG